MVQWKCIFLFGCLFSCIIAIDGIENTRFEKLEKLVENTLKKLAEKDIQINQLENIVHLQSNKIAQLEQKVQDQELAIQSIKGADIKGSANNNKDVEIKAPENDNRQTMQLLGKVGRNLQFLKEKKNRIRRAENENPVAFFATLSNNIEQLGAMQNIAFDNVVTDVSRSYNPHAGVFIAPVPGIYVFSVTIMSHGTLENHFHVLKNGQDIAKLHHHNTDYGITGMTFVLELETGDDVSLANVDLNKAVHGDDYSSFCGFLLQEYYSGPDVVGK